MIGDPDYYGTFVPGKDGMLQWAPPPVPSPAVAFLQSLKFTPHEMARFQDRARGVDRRLNHWLTTPRGKRYADNMAREIVRLLACRWSPL